MIDDIPWWYGAMESVFRHGDLARGVVMFFFGLTTGSFLNVVICRLPHGISLLWPPSSCPRCGSGIRLRDNVPVLGWLLLGGKCRTCGLPIAGRYPAVELANGLLWGFAAWQALGADVMGGSWERAVLALAQLLFLSTLLAISCIDLDYQIIPDELSYAGTAMGLGIAIGLPGWALARAPEFAGMFPAAGARFEAGLAAAAGMLAGAGAMGLITLLGTLVFRAKLKELQAEDPELDTAVGFGDVKLMAMIGAFLGWRWGLLSLAFGVIYAAAAGTVLMWRTGRWPVDEAGREVRWTLSACRARWASGEPMMPLGPYLSLGAATIFFAGPHITSGLTVLLNPR